MKYAVTQFEHSPTNKRQPIGGVNTVGGDEGVKQRMMSSSQLFHLQLPR